MDANVPVLPNTKSLWLVLLVAVLRSEEGLTLPTKHTMARIDKNCPKIVQNLRGIFLFYVAFTVATNNVKLRIPGRSYDKNRNQY